MATESADARERFSAMKIESWPDQDRALWDQARRSSVGLWAEEGFAVNWRPDTVRSCERAYGIYLRWLSDTGHFTPAALPLDRVSEALIRTFVKRFSVGRAEHTVASTVRGIAYVIRACHPPTGVAWLTQLAHRLTNSAVPVRTKILVTAPELLMLGEQLMDAGFRTGRIASSRSAILYRDGLMIALLVARPMRRRNLTGLQIGKTLHLGNREARIVFKRSETKTGRAINWPFPSFLRPALLTYVNDVRPVFRPPSNDEGWLWLNLQHRPMSATDVSHRIALLTSRHLGRRISPHLFRDVAATEIALSDPEHVGITKEILNHATLASSQRYYNQASSSAALSRYNDTLRKIRSRRTSDIDRTRKFLDDASK